MTLSMQYALTFRVEERNDDITANILYDNNLPLTADQSSV